MDYMTMIEKKFQLRFMKVKLCKWMNLIIVSEELTMKKKFIIFQEKFKNMVLFQNKMK